MFVLFVFLSIPCPPPKEREVKKNKLYSHTEGMRVRKKEREREKQIGHLTHREEWEERKCTYTGTASDLKRAANAPAIPLRECMRE